MRSNINPSSDTKEDQTASLKSYPMKQNRLTALGKNVWTKGEVQRILKNEKYVGDALLQKTFTVDCITHKVMKDS